jgi:hypothetical protein
MGGKTPSVPPAAGKPKKKRALQSERERLIAEQRARMQAPDPFAPENLKKLALRVGVPAVVAWIVAIAIPHWSAKAVVGALTLIVGGVLGWGMRASRKQRAVVEILRDAEGAEGRKEAIAKLGATFKEKDPTAVFAKAQLQMQEDPRAALATLETIALDKVLAPVADQARSERALIHLMLGEIDAARKLADGIDLGRHKDHRMRATLASVIGEAWARTGQAKRAEELLDTFDPEDADYADLKPQLFRARAFAYAWSDQAQKMKQVLRKMGAINVQLLFGFITKKKVPTGVAARGVHPLLEKEAYALVMKSAAVPRKMQVKRM